METKHFVEQINQTLEDIWIMLEKKERAYTQFKLNNQQFVILALIMRHPSISPSELADKMEITKSAVSQQLAKLETEGYIMKKQSPEDKRAFSIELGEKGLLYKKETDEFYEQLVGKYNEKLTPAEMANILSALQKLQQLME